MQYNKSLVILSSAVLPRRLPAVKTFNPKLLYQGYVLEGPGLYSQQDTDCSSLRL